jgi:hypothetical protein
LRRFRGGKSIFSLKIDDVSILEKFQPPAKSVLSDMGSGVE